MLVPTILIFGVLGFLYLLPAFVAIKRGSAHWRGIVLLDTLLGWTLLGWVAALVWAVSDGKAVDPETITHLNKTRRALPWLIGTSALVGLSVFMNLRVHQAPSQAVHSQSQRANIAPVSKTAGSDGDQFTRLGTLLRVLRPNSQQKLREDTLYDLSDMEAMQSTNEGILMIPKQRPFEAMMMENPYIAMGGELMPQRPTAFLYTTENLVDGSGLDGFIASYAGTYRYVTVLGSAKNIHAFRLYYLANGKTESGNAEHRRKAEELLSRRSFEYERQVRIDQEREKKRQEENQIRYAGDVAESLVSQELTKNCLGYFSNTSASLGDSWNKLIRGKTGVALEEPRFAANPNIVRISEGRWLVASFLDGRDTTTSRGNIVRKYFLVDLNLPSNAEPTLNRMEFSDNATQNQDKLAKWKAAFVPATPTFHSVPRGHEVAPSASGGSVQDIVSTYLDSSFLRQGIPLGTEAKQVPSGTVQAELKEQIRQLKMTQDLYPKDSISYQNLQHQINALSKQLDSSSASDIPRNTENGELEVDLIH